MTRSIRHAHSKRALARSASQRSASHDSATTGDASQRTGIAAPQAEPSKKRGRKPGSQTKLAMPLRGAKVALRPSGGHYVIYKPPYKYSSQLGVILRREYPGLVEDKDEDGRVIGDPRIALDWGDYFLSSPNELGVTSGDRVLSEFWRLFEVASDEQQEADRVLETYLKKRVKDLIYQARVECVKEYHWKQRGQVLDDTLDRSIELEYEQYFLGKLKWCNYEVWPKLCQYWCSEDFKKKRKIGQDCRLGTEDNAQNHGGSRPFTETQQVMKARFGPEKATPLNVYAVMKSGINGVDNNGNSGPIRSRKAQKRMDDYIAGVRTACVEDEDEELEEIEDEEEGKEQRQRQEPEQEQHLNGKVLYEMAGGTPHGRFPIANGAVRAADCRAAAKENRVQPSNSVSVQSMARENARLRSTNARLQQQVLQKDSALQQCNVATDLILELGKEIPDEAVQRLSAARAMNGNTQCSSEEVASC